MSSVEDKKNENSENELNSILNKTEELITMVKYWPTKLSDKITKL